MDIILQMKRFKFTVLRLMPFYFFQMLKKDNLEILNFKDLYINKRCFVVATGPSLTLEDLQLLKNEYTFSMNSIVKIFDKTDWRPTFYFLQDLHAYKELQPLSQYLKTSEIFVSQKIPLDEMDKEKVIQYTIRPYHDSKHLLDNKVGFRYDCEKYINDGRTVTFSIIQFAVYMGFKKIYLIGVDGNYMQGKDNHMKGLSLKHDESLEKDHDLQNHCMSISYLSAYEESQRSDFKIYNVGRNKNLHIYPYLELEDVLNMENI